MLYDVFVSAFWFQAVSLFLPSVTYLLTQARVLVSLREVFLGLFIFGKVGKNFCIRGSQARCSHHIIICGNGKFEFLFCFVCQSGKKMLPCDVFFSLYTYRMG